MKAIGKGCGEFLLVWAAVAAGLYFFYEPRFTPPGGSWGAGIGGFLVACSWGLLRNLIQARSRIALLQGSIRGRLPEDGKLFAVAGKVTPLGEPLISPFQDIECVAFGYNVFTEREVTTGRGSDRTTRTEKLTYMGGFAMCPSIVRSPVANMKILGFPLPDRFPETGLSAYQLREKILAYVEAHKVPIEKGVPLRSMLSQIGQVFTEDDGSHRYEWRVEELPDHLSHPDCVASEQCIPSGGQVVVIGTFDAKKQGLVSNLSDGGMEVFPGSIDDAISSLRGRIVSYVIFGVLLLGLGTFGSFGLLTLRETRDRTVVREKVEGLSEAVYRNDLASAEDLLKRGAEPNDVRVKQAVREGASADMVRLLVRSGLGVDIPDNYGSPAIFSAITRGDVERVRLWLELGADPNVAQSLWGYTPLDAAFDRGLPEIVTLLEEKGAKGTFAREGEGMPLPSGGGEPMTTITRYLLARESIDIPVLREVKRGAPEEYFTDSERGLYAQTGPRAPRFERGWMKGDVATVVISGAGGGGREIWVFTLAMRDGAWRIIREHWDSEGRWG